MTTFGFSWGGALKEEEYHLVRSYNIYVSPRYYQKHPEETPPGSSGEVAKVFQRIQ